MNKKRWQSEPRKLEEKLIPEPVVVNLEEKSHYEVDKDKQEIRLTLPTQLELEKLVDINDASVKASPKLAPKVKKV